MVGHNECDDDSDWLKCCTTMSLEEIIQGTSKEEMMV